MNDITTELPPSFELRRGHRKLYCLPDGEGNVKVLADCEIHVDAVIRFTVREDAMREFLSPDRSRNVQEIFPDLIPELREVLMTGISPAEFDHRTLGIPLPEDEDEFIRKYQPKGYCFED